MIEELIDKLGISRRMLSTLLHTTQSHLSRYENHTRNLPMAAIPQVAQLLALLHTAPPVPAPQPSPAEKEEAATKGAWCRVQVASLLKKLAALQKEYEQASNMLFVLDTYAQKEPAPDGAIKSWIAGQYYAANKKREAAGWLPQQLLKQKIAALQQEAQIWEAVVNDHTV